MVHYTQLMCTMSFMLNTCFPSENLEFCYVLGRGFLVTIPQRSGTERASLGKNIAHILCISTARKECAWCTPSWEGKQKEACGCISPDPHLCLLFLAYITIYPVAVINFIHEYNHISTPMSHSEFTEYVQGLGDP